MIQPINPENLQKKGKGRPRKEIRKTEAVTLWMEPWLKGAMVRKGITPKHLRDFIQKFGKPEEEDGDITSDEWQKLRDVLIASPSLQLIGNVNSGKSHIVKLLIKNEKTLKFILMDPHDDKEYEELNLPTIKAVTTNITTSVKLELPRSPIAAVAMLKIHKDMLLSNRWPTDMVLVLEEALRYSDPSIPGGGFLETFLAECRKNLKILTTSQRKMVDFLPSIKIKPFNKVDIRKIIGEGGKNE